MKTKRIMVVVCMISTSIAYGQNKKIQAIISQPEYNVLYKNYDNKVIVKSSSGQVIKVQAEGAKVSSQLINGENGFLIRPSWSNTCKLISTIRDDKGLEHKDTSVFIVRPFPSPIITTTTISKSSGAKINVSLPSDSFLAGIDYDVKAIEVLGVMNGAMDGNVIKASLLTSVKVGETIGIIVFAKNNYTGQMMTINGSLEVSD